MKKSEAKLQTAGEKLEAPVQLTPEQLEAVAAGFKAQIAGKSTTGGTTVGRYPTGPVLKQF